VTPAMPAPAGGSAGLKHVFVVGVPRSGTTWTMLLLAQHPAIAATQQVDFFGVLQPLETWWTKAGEFGRNVVSYSEAGHARTDLSEVLAPEEFYDFARPMADHVFGQVGRSKPGAQVVVEQSPEHAELAELILKIFPQAHFLHVVRDPRSVFCSLRSASSSSAWKGSSGFPTDPVDIARIWVSYIEKGRRIGAATPNYREVRYERLIEDGPRELGLIFDWLGLPSDPAMCEQAIERCQIDKLRGGAIAPAAFFRKGEAQGWRAEASPFEVRCIEYVAGGLMESCGYDLAHGTPKGKPMRLVLRESVTGMLQRVVGGPMRPALRRLRRLVGPLS